MSPLLADERDTEMEEAVSVTREVDRATTKRVSIDFGIPAYERLKELKEQTQATTLSAVIRDALRFYMWAFEQQQDGYKVAAIREHGDQLRIREVTIP